MILKIGLRNCLCLVGFCIVVTGAQSGSMIFPEKEWESATPESQGVNSDKLDEALKVLEAAVGKDGIREVVVARNGYLIHAGNNIDKQHGVWSTTKSFTSTVLGLLIDDKKCALATLAKDHAAALASNYPDLTLRHFATMTSGYDAKGWASWGKGQNYDFGDGDDKPWIPDASIFSPGTAYAYWDEAINMFGYVLTQIAQESMYDLFKRRIADPISMNSSGWDWARWTGIDGFDVNGGGGSNSKHVLITARQLARFGHLFLNKGNWNGQQLISEAWVEQATKNQVPTSLKLGDTYRSDLDGRGIYGYNWWVNGIKSDGQRNMPDASTGIFYTSGFNNNMCFVIPEWNMVVVRMGLDGNPADKPEVYNKFFAKLATGIEIPTVIEEVPGELDSKRNLHIYVTPYTSNSLKLRITIRGASAGIVRIYDTHGALIADLGRASGNVRVFTWDPTTMGGGIYFIRAFQGAESVTEKVFLMK